jgi:hypothetical protein
MTDARPRGSVAIVRLPVSKCDQSVDVVVHKLGADATPIDLGNLVDAIPFKAHRLVQGIDHPQRAMQGVELLVRRIGVRVRQCRGPGGIVVGDRRHQQFGAAIRQRLDQARVRRSIELVVVEMPYDAAAVDRANDVAVTVVEPAFHSAKRIGGADAAIETVKRGFDVDHPACAIFLCRPIAGGVVSIRRQQSQAGRINFTFDQLVVAVVKLPGHSAARVCRKGGMLGIEIRNCGRVGGRFTGQRIHEPLFNRCRPFDTVEC